jgi:hypothetical protein
MEIPLYASGPDRKLSWKGYGTQRRRAFAALGTNYVCSESNNIRDNRHWSLQTNGRATGLRPSARGAITGVLLGASLWGAILVLAGLIKV